MAMPRGFIASESTLVARGAGPIVADAYADSGDVEAESAEAVLTERTSAVIAVHIGGWPCDMSTTCDLPDGNKTSSSSSTAPRKTHGGCCGYGAMNDRVLQHAPQTRTSAPDAASRPASASRRRALTVA